MTGLEVAGLNRRTVALLAAAAPLGMGAILVLVGSWIDDRDNRLLVAPTDAPSAASPGPSTAVTPAPSVTIAAGDIHLVPETTALFAAPLPGNWRPLDVTEINEGGYRIVTDSELGPSWDPVSVAWITISASSETMESAQAEMQAAGWTAPPQVVDVPGLEGIVLSADPIGGVAQGRDPTALIVWRGATYRISAHNKKSPGLRQVELIRFLRFFRPLGFAADAEQYRDEVWRFTFVNIASGGRFVPGLELGNGVTRFGDVTCGSTDASCKTFVDVVRVPSGSLLRLTLPDERDVALAIDPSSDDYVTLAADWETVVGKSRGSSWIFWQGTPIYDVDNLTLGARFIHRGDQWLVILSSEAEPGGQTSRLDAFLQGLTLLP
ncbi:MAG TPA: hypothetical protein VIF63_03920 [Candidatus Limnocylindrales bacterium]|jgi:hypothetical protein